MRKNKHKKIVKRIAPPPPPLFTMQFETGVSIEKEGKEEGEEEETLTNDNEICFFNCTLN